MELKDYKNLFGYMQVQYPPPNYIPAGDWEGVQRLFQKDHFFCYGKPFCL